MSLILSQFVTAMLPGLSTSVVGIGGIFPLKYTVVPDGAGGTIDLLSGLYTAPAEVNPDPKKSFDIIQVTDSSTPPKVATGKIRVVNIIGLFCDVLQNQLNLADDHIYFWDQKISQPKDSSLYIAVSIPSTRPFANTSRTESTDTGLAEIQTVNMQATFEIDIISRGPEARDRKEEVILALNSFYSQSQQVLNGFLIAKLPPNSRFVNLSSIDGAAIPYRFKISVNVQYEITKTRSIPYIDDFQNPTLSINS